MKTLLEVLNLATDHLKGKGIQNARRPAEEVICDSLNTERVKLYMEFDRPLTEEELQICRAHLLRRAKGEPAAYIRGFVDFYDCRICVTPDVLIPRQETEILVDLIVPHL